MASSSLVSVIAPAGGRKNYVGHEVPKLNLAAYSHHARHLYFPGSTPKMFAVGKRNTSNNNEFDLGPDMDEDYARIIVTHIKSADPTDPKPLTMQVFGKDLSMGDLVKIYRLIGAGFKVPREVHQDDVRGHLRGMIYTADPFELYHFKVIAENLDFDRGLVHSAMDRVVYLHIKEELADSVRQEVEEYCKGREGYWDDMLNTVGLVLEAIEKSQDLKALREARERDGIVLPEESAQQGRKGKGKGRAGGHGGAQTRGKSGGNKHEQTANEKKQPAEAESKGKKSDRAKPFVVKPFDDDFPPLG